MMANDAEIPAPGDDPEIAGVVALPDDEILVEGAEAEKPKPEPAPERSAEEGIEALKQQLAAEKLARAQLERQARQTEEEAARYRSQAERSQADNLASSVDLATQEVEKQKAAYKSAMEAGDYSAAAEAQAALSEAAAAKTMATQARSAYEARLKTQAEQRPPQQTFTPRTQAWLNDHPDVLTDPVQRQKAALADSLARTEGMIPDTDAYFARVETIMGMRQDAPARQPSPVAAPVSAPVTRGAETRPTLHLTAAEKEFCDASGISRTEYAKNKALAARQSA